MKYMKQNLFKQTKLNPKNNSRETKSKGNKNIQKIVNSKNVMTSELTETPFDNVIKEN